MVGITKRSIEIAGHRTSISLENEFWVALKKIAELEQLSLTALIRKIDETTTTSVARNLSSTIRVYILNYVFVNKGLTENNDSYNLK